MQRGRHRGRPEEADRGADGHQVGQDRPQEVVHHLQGRSFLAYRYSMQCLGFSADAQTNTGKKSAINNFNIVTFMDFIHLRALSI